jgi:RNA polymerase sigma-70 factor (ECF subfamily)
MKDERRLIKDVVNNRSQAVEALYDRYAPSLLSVCFRYAGNLQDAEDILHEAFIKIIKKLPEFRPKFENSLEAWMKRIMINTALNYLRDQAKNRGQLSLDQVVLNDGDDEAEDVEIDYLHSDISPDRILELIAALPAGYRTVFNLYVFEGYSHKEISHQLNCSENTSKSQLSKARANLRSKIFEMTKTFNTE